VGIAEKMVAEADAEIAKRCRDLGIRPEFRPGLGLAWYGRGENAEAARRTELRKVAQTRLEANARAAKVEVERQVAALLTDLAASALSSDDAKAFQDEMPTPEQLMPGVTILELEEKIEDNE
jgi:hypothetical protein